jgi:hypothetical protein
MKKRQPNPDDPVDPVMRKNLRARGRKSAKAFREMTGPVQLDEELTAWLTKQRPDLLKLANGLNQSG